MWGQVAAAGLGLLGGALQSRRAKRDSRAARDYYRQAAQMDRERWRMFQSHAIPQLSMLASQAEITPAERARSLGMAGASVDTAFDQARGRLDRSLALYGGGGLHAGALRDLSLSRAAAKAGALTDAERGLDEAQFERHLRAGSLLAGALGGSGAGTGMAARGLGGMAAASDAAAGSLYRAGIGAAGSALDEWLARREA